MLGMMLLSHFLLSKENMKGLPNPFKTESRKCLILCMCTVIFLGFAPDTKIRGTIGEIQKR